MGKNSFSGGGTLLNNEAGFATYDPAEEQKRSYVRSEPAYKPVRPSIKYTVQVQEQLRILLTHIANGKKKPHVPMIFKEEIEAFGSLVEWAKSKPEFEILLKERESAPPKKKVIKRNAKRELNGRKVPRFESPPKNSSRKSSGEVSEDNSSTAEQLEKLEALMSELLEERRKPWYSEKKKQAITERYHSVKKKHAALRNKAML